MYPQCRAYYTYRMYYIRRMIIATDAHAPITTRLPQPATSFMGRESDIAYLRQQVQQPDVRLVTLTGPGGIGKTRLALRVGMVLTDVFTSVSFVPLAALTDATLVLPTIARTLGISDSADQSLLEAIAATLRAQTHLMILDNCEHVLDARVVVTDMLEHCPTLTIVATSRAALHVSPEHVFPVPPLPLPPATATVSLSWVMDNPAIALFAARAHAADPQFTLTPTNMAVVAQVCRALDGLPLAIELAAVRVRLLPPATLLARLTDRLSLLSKGTSDAPTRHQTLRELLGWSYQNLTGAEARLFAQLGIFRSGFSLEAVERVCTIDESDTSIVAALDGLVDKSLVQTVLADDGTGRLRLLETIRAFALEQIVDTDALWARYVAYYRELANTANDAMRGAQPEMWFERLEAEHDNLRAVMDGALERDDGESAMFVAKALWRFWWARGYIAEGRRWLERALDAGVTHHTTLRDATLTAAATVNHLCGDNARAIQLFEAAIVLARALDDTYGLANALNSMAIVLTYTEDLARARAALDESQTISRASGDKRTLAATLCTRGTLKSDAGDLAGASRDYAESLALYRSFPDIRNSAGLLLNLGQTRQRQGLFDPALALLHESLTTFRTLDDAAGSIEALHNIGVTHYYRKAWAEAHEALTEAADHAAHVEDRWAQANIQYALGRVAAAQGQYVAALAQLKEAVRAADTLGNTLLFAQGIEAIADVCSRYAQVETAVRLLGAAQHIRHLLKVGVAALDRPAHEALVAALRKGLADDAYSTAWGIGKSAERPALLSNIQEIYVAPTPPRPSFGGDLTAREYEVLTLIAAGLTNAQIAQKLVLSTRTVTSYIESIFSKLDVTSRTAAVQAARDRGLL